MLSGFRGGLRETAAQRFRSSVGFGTWFDFQPDWTDPAALAICSGLMGLIGRMDCERLLWSGPIHFEAAEWMDSPCGDSPCGDSLREDSR